MKISFTTGKGVGDKAELKDVPDSTVAAVATITLGGMSTKDEAIKIPAMRCVHCETEQS